VEDVPLVAIELGDVVLRQEIRKANNARLNVLHFRRQVLEFGAVYCFDRASHHRRMLAEARQGIRSIDSLLREVKAAEYEEDTGASQAQDPLDEEL